MRRARQNWCQKAPSAKWCIKTMLILGAGTVIFRFVRKHRAPKGALRLFQTSTDFDNAVLVRKHRAPKGALRHSRTFFKTFEVASQKAPSAKRCIKTPRHGLSKHQTHQVRKHRAPKGALRPRLSELRTLLSEVRKHRAPKGALRLPDG